MSVMANLAISADGRFVAFTSNAGNLVPGKTNTSASVYLRDTILGVTSLISTAMGTDINENRVSFTPTMSADGRLVAFTSDSTNLTPGFSPSASMVNHVYVRDTLAGTTTLIDAGHHLVGADEGASEAHISGGGTVVAFNAEGLGGPAGHANVYATMYTPAAPGAIIRHWVDLLIAWLRTHVLLPQRPPRATG